MFKKLKENNKKGFTLVELIVVLVILAILAALLIPALTGYIDKARNKSIVAETRQTVMAAQTLVDEHPSLTVSKRQNSCKSRIYGLCGCLFVCIDMCYIFVFVLVVFFVFEIIPRMEAFDINSKSVLNPNEL